MQPRPSSRILLINARRQILLFRFVTMTGGARAIPYWATPGGGVDDGESFAAAATRELFEEVGLVIDHPGAEIARRTAIFAMPSGETVEADERYFAVEIDHCAVSDAHWTDHERRTISAHRWWDPAELAACDEQVWPEDLVDMLVEAGFWPPS